MNAVETSEYEQALERHGSELQGKKLILSVERLDYTKGIPQKLDAIRLYLETHPDLALKVVFVIIAVPSRGGNEEYAQLTERVQREVGSINGDFGTVGHAPVQLLYRSFPQPELAALYGLADVCLVTPLIDGMNLVAKEYIDCKTEHPKIRPGVLVLSEFAGAAPEMSHAVLVNPYDVLETAQAIHDALEMGPEERKERSRAMQGHLRRTDASVWASRFMNDLKSVPSSEQQIADLRLEGLARNLAARVNAGERVALALDYDGTLRSFVSHPDDAVPDVDLCPLLSSIAKHPLIDVAVVSGRPAEFLEKHFAGLGITLVAEHGYRWLRPDTKHWALVHEHIDTDWKADVLPHLEQAVRLTPGSHMEEKQSSIVWHYRRADPEFGLWRARGLLDELTDVTASLPVAVHHGKKIVEVASQLVNKGQAVKALVNDWQPSVLLAAGDDQTDETMFALELDSLEFITVNVGNGPTRAERRTNIKGLRQSLENLAALLK